MLRSLFIEIVLFIRIVLFIGTALGIALFVGIVLFVGTALGIARAGTVNRRRVADATHIIMLYSLSRYICRAPDQVESAQDIAAALAGPGLETTQKQ